MVPVGSQLVPGGSELGPAGRSWESFWPSWRFLPRLLTSKFCDQAHLSKAYSHAIVQPTQSKEEFHMPRIWQRAEASHRLPIKSCLRFWRNCPRSVTPRRHSKDTVCDSSHMIALFAVTWCQSIFSQHSIAWKEIPKAAFLTEGGRYECYEPESPNINWQQLCYCARRWCVCSRTLRRFTSNCFIKPSSLAVALPQEIHVRWAEYFASQICNIAE